MSESLNDLISRLLPVGYAGTTGIVIHDLMTGGNPVDVLTDSPHAVYTILGLVALALGKWLVCWWNGDDPATGSAKGITKNNGGTNGA